MKFLTMLLFALMISSEDYTVDFGKQTGGADWTVVNDDVMGGRSTSEAYLTENFIHFEGTVSLENNGGFASIRSPYEVTDLSSFEKVSLRFRGTNRKFALSLDNSRAWYRPNYKHEFTPNGSDWQEITVPLNEFKESSVGRFTGNNMGKTQLARVIRMGLILFDKNSGPFELDVDYIKFH